MLIVTETILSQIQKTKSQWSSVAPSVAGNPLAAEITQELEQIESILANLPDEVEINAIPWQTANSQLAAMVQHSGNTAQISGMTSWLWTFKNALLDSLPTKLVAQEKGLRATKALEARIDLIEQYLSKAEEAKGRLEEAVGKADEMSQKVDELSTSVKAASERISEHQEAAADSDGAAKKAATEAGEKLEEMTEILEGINVATEKQQALFKEFENRRDEIANLLENANKVGLARSFQDKRRELTWTWRGWAAVFAIGIAGLIWMGYAELLPLLQVETVDPMALAFRFLLSGPVIWFTWFAARQYGHVLRISEDYAFKEAAAMAFVGYRNEVETDEEMLKLLQQTAIRNFGANPAKLLLHKADSASPIHEALDRALEKVKPEELLGALSKLTGRDK